MSARARRQDANHAAVRSAFRSLGCEVQDTSGLAGFVDLVVCTPTRSVLLVEVKDGAKPPSKRALTPAQVSLHARFPVSVVGTEAEAAALVTGGPKSSICDTISPTP